MDLTNMTPTERAAWHRSEADRIEAEERARRPALAAGQVWRDSETGQDLVSRVAPGREKFLHVSDVYGEGLPPACAYGNGFILPDRYAYLGLARDVLRVVPPKWEEERSLLLELESLYRGTSRESREMNAVLRRLDAIHNPSIVVPPEPPAPQVAPEPTGAELVNRDCWVRDCDSEEWRGPHRISHFATGSKWPYESGGNGFWSQAKPYVEGVAP